MIEEPKLRVLLVGSSEVRDARYKKEDGTLIRVDGARHRSVGPLAVEVNRTGVVHERSIEALEELLFQFGENTRQSGDRGIVVGGGALRSALNSEIVREKLQNAVGSGIEVKVLNGKEEGELLFIGAREKVPALKHAPHALTLDVGASSVEGIYSIEGQVSDERALSFDCGGANLNGKLEKLGLSACDSEGREIIEAEALAIVNAFRVVGLPSPPTVCVLTGGTPRIFLNILGRSYGDSGIPTLHYEELMNLQPTLCTLAPEEIGPKYNLKLDNQRASRLYSMSVLLGTLCRELRIEESYVPLDVDLKLGVAQLLAESEKASGSAV